MAAGQGYKGTKKQRAISGEKIYRSEWRVTSSNRAPRMEVFDISFSRGQEIHEHLSRKLGLALQQLQRNVLRFGENAELSKVYFVGKN